LTPDNLKSASQNLWDFFGGGGDPIVHETKEIKTVAICLGLGPFLAMERCKCPPSCVVVSVKLSVELVDSKKLLLSFWLESDSESEVDIFSVDCSIGYQRSMSAITPPEVARLW